MNSEQRHRSSPSQDFGSTVSRVLDSLARDARFWDPAIFDLAAADGALATALLTGILGAPHDPRSALVPALFSLVPEVDVQALVDRAVLALVPTRAATRGARRGAIGGQAPAEVVAEASIQEPSACHAHLPVLFDAGRQGPQMWRAFREASPASVRFLLDMLPALEGAERRRAILALLETRHPDVMNELLSASSVAAEDLEHVGFEQAGASLRRLYAPQPLHLAFPPEYVEALPKHVTHLGVETLHPTWNAALTNWPYLLGGRSAALCALCGARLQDLLHLESVPEAIGVTSVQGLELVTCFSCLGWEAPALMYQHDGHGHPRSICPAGVEPHAPQFPVDDALRVTRVGLVPAGRRWRWQEWSVLANLHRVGGHPSWIQNAAYPQCPGCGGRMAFLAQIDSNLLRLERAEGWLWGSGGVCYLFWCDACRVSGTSYQCT
jgi:hypothetical protein